MTLTPGARLGPYEIQASIGAGGMGEVYRARDTTLDRDVAIKVLPEAVARDPERLSRFEREAKSLAALNHPNVAQIYAVEAGAIVMELVPGDTLRGPLPLDRALDYAAQIASALEAAHDKGIVHRDLKPGNVMVTPEGVVKVLDFSLAGRAPSSAGTAADLSPTLTAQATLAGVIIGTAAYMAPEQAAGRPVDKRADIWAFGVLLWEMLTGRQMFEGETVSHVLAAVLTKEPDLTAVPPRIRPLLARCVEKDPKKRLRDIGDAMSLVPGQGSVVPGTDTGAPAPGWLWRWTRVGGWAVAGVLAAVLVVVAGRSPAPPAGDDPPAVRFQVERAADVYNRTTTAFAVSPDGLRLAYYGTGRDGLLALFVRTLATGEVREVTGSVTGAPSPDSLFWSPDGRQLASATAAGSRVFDVAGGAARPICDCRYVGGSWNRDGTILLGAFGTAREGISRVSVGDRTRVPVTTVDASKGEQDTWPVFLPDGRRFLFTRSSAGAEAATYLATLDGGTPIRIADGSWRVLVPGSSGRRSYLLGVDSSGVVARPFGLESASVTGSASTVASGAIAVSASETGVLVTSAAGNRPRTVPTWYDRTGTPLGHVGEPGFIEGLALSPDGRKLAVSESRSGPEGRRSDIWLLDVARGARTRFTFTGGSTPVWSPDGTRIAFTSARNGVNLPHVRAADGTGTEVPLFRYDQPAWTNDWKGEGRFVIFSTPTAGGSLGNDLWFVSITGGTESTPAAYLTGPAIQQQAQFSPDGRFVAYGSDESGIWEIYVQPFPDASGGKWMVSNGGGVEPRWSRDGTELFYVSGQTLMAVPVRLRPTFSSGAPAALFDAPVQPGYIADSHRWQLAPDGKRFLLLANAGDNQAPPLDVLVNWAGMVQEAPVPDP